MNILSIDFDFFQYPTKEELLNYPDGVDLPSDISEITWSMHRRNTKDVQFDYRNFRKIIDIITEQKPCVPVQIVNSHIHAYNFIKSIYDSTPLTVYNIDYHHDLFNNNEKLDCGNWLRFVKKDFNANIRWITKKNSIDTYGIEKDIVKKCHIAFGLNELENIQFDAIFICRSDPWTPPQFDKHFDKLLKLCCNKFDKVIGTKDIRTPRKVYEYKQPQ